MAPETAQLRFTEQFFPSASPDSGDAHLLAIASRTRARSFHDDSAHAESREKAGRAPTVALFPDPDPWPEPVPGAVLLDDMAATLRRFVLLSPAAVDAEAIWCLH